MMEYYNKHGYYCGHFPLTWGFLQHNILEKWMFPKCSLRTLRKGMMSKITAVFVICNVWPSVTSLRGSCFICLELPHSSLAEPAPTHLWMKPF